MILLQAPGSFDIGNFLSGVVNDDSLVSGLIFSGTRGYIYGLVRNFGLQGFGNIQQLLLTVLTLYLTLWFILQGWRIATGRTQANMLQFSQKAVTAAFVMWLALLGVNHSANIVDKIEELQSIITTTIAGDEFKNPEKMLDGTLVLMQMMGNKLEAGLSDTPDSKTMLNTGLLFVTGMGQALPALISGGLLLLNRIALYLCIMFAPLCLAAYLFESTRFMFVTWAKFTVSTLFSMAVITVIVVIAIKAVLFVTAALMLAEMTGGVDLKSIATAQGGVGMLLTTLVLGGPPLVTNFFSGQVSAAVNAYNAVGGLTGSGGSPSSPEEMMKRASGGGNGQKNDAGGNAPNDVAGDKKLLGTNQAAANPNNDGVKPIEQARLAVNRSDAGGNYSTGAPSGGGSAAANAATNVAEEHALTAQKAQQSSASTTAATANYAATNTASSTTASGSNAASTTATGSTGTTTASTVSNSTSSDSSVRLANTGIGDDSIALNQKYGSRGLNSPNRTTA